MESVNNIFGIRESKNNALVRPERQSIEQTEDYAFKKVIHTQELIVNGTAYGGSSGVPHEPTIYRGSDFTGSNPTKELTHSRSLPVNMTLIIGGRVMYRTLEYTIAGDKITMVDTIIDDDDYVMVCD